MSFADAESLVALRIEAMRESLERIGRFDPLRARERFLSGLAPEHTRHVVLVGEVVGFVVVKPHEQGLLLDHLYIRPHHQGKGIGAAVLAQVFTEADAQGASLRVGALRDSDSNRFYARHGFVLVDQGEFDNYYVRAGRKAPGWSLMKIEHALLEDAPAIAKIHVHAWQVAYESILPADYLASLSIESRTDQWGQCISNGTPEVIVAKNDGEVVGWLCFGKCRDVDASPTDAEVWTLYVAPSAWSRGVGRALWLEAERLMRQQTFNRCSLWVFAQNERAIRFYRAAGFVADPAPPKSFELGGRRLLEARYTRRFEHRSD